MKILWTVAALLLASLSTAGAAADRDAKKAESAQREGKGEVAKADAQRRKPLQRCDQLKGDAELECLKKARERVVEARKKRESTAKGDESKLKDQQVERDTSPQKGKKP